METTSTVSRGRKYLFFERNFCAEYKSSLRSKELPTAFYLFEVKILQTFPELYRAVEL